MRKEYHFGKKAIVSLMRLPLPVLLLEPLKTLGNL